MKPNRFLLAGLSLATALTLSCSENGKNPFGGFGDGNGLLNGVFGTPGSNNLLQNSRLGFMSSEDGIPTDDTADSIITDVQINGGALSGGSTSITVKSIKKLKELYLQIEGEPGFYRWVLEPDDEIGTNPYIYQIALEFNRTLGTGGEGTTPTFTVSGRTMDDEISKPVEEELKVIKVGNGALQISLSWNNTDDVDLYVWTPSGERLFWNNRKSSHSDKKDSLDIDANYNCHKDSIAKGINAENVYFGNPLDTGSYKVAVQLYNKCSTEPREGARYNVTANVKGEFIDFGGKDQSGKFDDSERGIRTGSLASYPTSNTSTNKAIGIIRINSEGKFEPASP